MKGEFRQCKMEGHQLGRVVAGMELVCLQHPQAWKDLQCLVSNQLGCNLKGLCQWKLHQRFNKLWEAMHGSERHEEVGMNEKKWAVFARQWMNFSETSKLSW